MYTSPEGYHLPFFSYTLKQLKASWWLCFSTCSFPLCPGLDFAESRAKQIYIMIWRSYCRVWPQGKREGSTAKLPVAVVNYRSPEQPHEKEGGVEKERERESAVCPPRPVTKDPSYASWSVDLAAFQAGHVWAHRRFPGHFILFCFLTGTGLGGKSDSQLPRTNIPGDWNVRRDGRGWAAAK